MGRELRASWEVTVGVRKTVGGHFERRSPYGVSTSDAQPGPRPGGRGRVVSTAASRRRALQPLQLRAFTSTRAPNAASGKCVSRQNTYRLSTRSRDSGRSLNLNFKSIKTGSLQLIRSDLNVKYQCVNSDYSEAERVNLLKPSRKL